MTKRQLKMKNTQGKEKKAGSRDVDQSNVNMLSYFRSSAKIEAEKEDSRLII